MDIRDIEISVDPHSAIWELYMQDEQEPEFEVHIAPQQPTHIEVRTRAWTLGKHPRAEQVRIYTNRPF